MSDDRKPQNEIRSIILERLDGQTEPVSKQELLKAVYSTGYTNSQGESVTQALTALEAEKKVRHPSRDNWLPAAPPVK